MDKCREAFEAIALKNKWNINKDPYDFYIDDFVNGAWWAFEEQQKQIDDLVRQKKILIDALYLKSDAIHFNGVMQTLKGGEVKTEHRINTKCGNLFCDEPSEELLCPKCKEKVRNG